MKLEALIAYLASRTQIRGKKALQKLVYFCREAGVPLYATYRLHVYGPYSNEVAEELRTAVDKEIVAIDQDGFTFFAGSACQLCLNEYRRDIGLYRDEIERVLACFGPCSPVELELYA
ncbi:MAG: hypothetical protein H5T84_01175, partial [Thermoleophilia bacterium]|nr:hypothetical protein [Thermoleophilia bacterium]